MGGLFAFSEGTLLCSFSFYSFLVSQKKMEEDKRVRVEVIFYPFLYFSSTTRGFDVKSGYATCLDAGQGFQSRADVTKVIEVEPLFLPPVVVSSETLKKGRAQDWYPLGNMAICRMCYAYEATRSCCIQDAHKTLCAACTATKCDICGHCAPAAIDDEGADEYAIRIADLK
jgi:hypothetical protein